MAWKTVSTKDGVLSSTDHTKSCCARSLVHTVVRAAALCERDSHAHGALLRTVVAATIVKILTVQPGWARHKVFTPVRVLACHQHDKQDLVEEHEEKKDQWENSRRLTPMQATRIGKASPPRIRRVPRVKRVFPPVRLS